MSVFIYLMCFHLPVQSTNNHKLYLLCENLNDRSISKASSTWNDQMLSPFLGGIMHLISGHANQEQLPNVDLYFQCLHWDVFLGCFSSTLVLPIFLDRENEVGKFIPKAAMRNAEQHKAVLKRCPLGGVTRIMTCKPVKLYSLKPEKQVLPVEPYWIMAWFGTMVFAKMIL